MLHAPGLLALVAASALAASLAGCGNEEAVPAVPKSPARPEQALAAQRAISHQLYWVGPSFDGLPLTRVLRGSAMTTFIYGTCIVVGSDGGCSPPLQIQVSAICDRNALVLDIRPHTIFTARGTTVLDYGEGRLELNAGASHVVVSADQGRGRRAIAALRAVRGPQRVTARLGAPRYPLYYIDQLRRVRDAYTRTRTLRAVRDQLGISKSAARFELRLARELGAARLRRDTRAAPVLRDIKRDRLAATMADNNGERRAAQMLAMTVAELRARAQRGRELRSSCELESA